jgi:N-acetylglucosaminyl-diphospho-decaprenol L-rhamnosyltransferase
VTASQVAVVIVNHDTREHLRHCLDAVTSEAPGQVIVVDTASSDGSVDAVRRRFPAVRVLEMENRGYGAGANAGLREIDLPYAVVLNADTRPAPAAMAILAAYLDDHPRAAIAGPLVVDSGGRIEATARRFPTPFELLLQETGLHRLRIPRGAEPRRVDWVLGAALALRTEAVKDAGGFDESYVMYNEEVDLCLRMAKRGWEVHYVPAARVAHAGGASTSQQRSVMAARYVRSTVALYRRHYTPWQLAATTAILATALDARKARDRTRRVLARDGERRAALGAQIHAWDAARTALRDRASSTSVAA